MSNAMDDSDQVATPRRPYAQLASPRACRDGQHKPMRPTVLDASGMEHSRCRVCGCALSRMPVLRRWFRSGQMG